MRRALLILLAASSLAACATTEDVVPVAYTPTTAGRVAGAEAVTVTLTTSDTRSENRARIGTQINGFGQDMAAIRSREDVTVIVQNALTGELRQRGYALADNGVRVNAAVDRFFNRFSTGMLTGQSTADVILVVTVTDASGRMLYRRPVAGRTQREVMMANGETAADSLSLALSQAVTMLFGDANFTAALRGTASTDITSRPTA